MGIWLVLSTGDPRRPTIIRRILLGGSGDLATAYTWACNTYNWSNLYKASQGHCKSGYKPSSVCLLSRMSLQVNWPYLL